MNSNEKLCSSRDMIRLLARVGIFGALAALFYIAPFLKFPMPIFAGFLEVNFSDIIALISGFAFGPLTGALVQVVKVLIKLPFTSTAMVGELADLLLGIVFVVPAAIFYRFHKSKSGAVKALIYTSLIHVVIAAVLNWLILTPFYVQFYFGGAEQVLIDFVASTNPNVTDLGWTYILWAIIPFNIFRNVLISAITFLLYKRLHKFIRRIAFLG